MVAEEPLVVYNGCVVFGVTSRQAFLTAL